MQVSSFCLAEIPFLPFLLLALGNFFAGIGFIFCLPKRSKCRKHSQYSCMLGEEDEPSDHHTDMHTFWCSLVPKGKYQASISTETSSRAHRCRQLQGLSSILTKHRTKYCTLYISYCTEMHLYTSTNLKISGTQ